MIHFLQQSIFLSFIIYQKHSQVDNTASKVIKKHSWQSPKNSTRDPCKESVWDKQETRRWNIFWFIKSGFGWQSIQDRLLFMRVIDDPWCKRVTNDTAQEVIFPFYNLNDFILCLLPFLYLYLIVFYFGSCLISITSVKDCWTLLSNWWTDGVL